MTGIDRTEIKAIFWLRALACFAVALHHYTKGPILAPGALKTLFWWSWPSVYVFFFVSGFVIPWSLHASRYKLSSYPRFLMKRLIRIEPPYLVSILVVLAVSAAGIYRLAPPVLDWKQLLLHVGYLNALVDKPWLNPVFWTLGVEFQFYVSVGILFPLLFSGRAGVRAATILGVLALTFVSRREGLIFTHIPFFVAGLATALRWFKLVSMKEFAFYIVACAVAARFYVPYLFLLFPLPLVIFYVKADHPVIRRLNDLSFSFYLLHVPIGAPVVNYFRGYARNNAEGVLAVAAAFGVTLCFAHVYYVFVERPFFRAAKRIPYKTVM